MTRGTSEVRRNDFRFLLRWRISRSQRMPVALLLAVSLPSAAFWMERVLESQVWYMRDGGWVRTVLEPVSPNGFLMLPLLVVQLIVIIQSWPRLSLSLRFVAILLACLPLFALVVLPILLWNAFR